MQIGIAVDGMADTYVTGNTLNYVKQRTGACPTKVAILADTKFEPGIENGVQKSIQQANPALISGNSHSYTVPGLNADANYCRIGDHPLN
jgi:hypothetical protein